MKKNIQKKIWIVVPTYNEAGNIQILLPTIFEELASRTDIEPHVLVVDDNSPDGTGEIVEEITKKNSAVELIRGEKNGLGEAYKRGFAHVMAKDDVYAIMQMDADLSHDSTKLSALIDGLTDNDVMIGSRNIDGGFIPGNWPLMRILNTRVARFVTRYIGGVPATVTDPTAGFRAFRPSALATIDVENFATAAGYVFQVRLTNAAVQHNLRISEVPINFRDRAVGESKIQLRDIAEFIYCCATLNTRAQIKRYAPAFLTAFATALVVGVMTYVIVDRLSPPLPIAAVFFAYVMSAVADVASQLYTAARRQRHAINADAVFSVRGLIAMTVLSLAIIAGFDWQIVLLVLVTGVLALLKVRNVKNLPFKRYV